jgi:hypothetical protein
MRLGQRLEMSGLRVAGTDIRMTFGGRGIQARLQTRECLIPSETTGIDDLLAY